MNLLSNLIASALLFGAVAPAQAGLFSFQFSGDNVTSVQDPLYFERFKDPNTGLSTDTTSRIYTSLSTYDGGPLNGIAPTLQATMQGRYYDSDPQRGSEWGILDQSSVDFTEKPDNFSAFVVKYGIRPSAIGSRTSNLLDANGNPAAASYIEFTIGSSDNVVFDELTVSIDEISAIEPTNVVWAEASSDDQNRVVTPTITRDDEGVQKISFSWAGLSIDGSALTSQSIRVYGIKGSDYGNFKDATISGSISPPPVPEGSSAMLLGLGLFTGLARRRR
jgi:hypothetical protein